MEHYVDERFKDASPEDTVRRIKQILSQNGISVTEHWNPSTVSNCHALRLTIDGTQLGTNGKGVSPALANASAHAELMERLQANLLGFGKRQSFTDAVMMDRQTVKEHCQDYLQRLQKILLEFEGVQKSTDALLDTVMDYSSNGSTVEVVPFYSVTDDQMVYLPRQFTNQLYGTTGNSAGNSPEEAIVQGMSEIVERWFQRHFMWKDLVPPTVPEEYLQQFPTTYATICDIRSNGYDVIIKDCSMGSGYPVIATAVISKKTHNYHVHLGASPVFAIALARSLTETFQGRMIHNVTDTSLSEDVRTDVNSFHRANLYGQGAYPIEFFTEESSFPFVPFEDRSHCNNRQLLGYVVDFLRQRNMKMYVRDMSHMGFCSYKIIVPDMCDSPLNFLTAPIPVAKLSTSTSQIRFDLPHATPDQLFELLMYYFYRVDNDMVDHDPTCRVLLSVPISREQHLDRAVGHAHLGYVCWACGNKAAALNYVRTIAASQVPGISDFFSCLEKVVSMRKAGKTTAYALKHLSSFYDSDTIEKVSALYAQGTNPFADYIVTGCGDGSGCATCRYRKDCLRDAHRRITEIVEPHIQRFDNEAAFQKLRTLFTSL